jgi:cysteine desulfurase
VGALYIRKGVRIHNLIYGGAQERNLRAGTENLASIVGLGKAIELAVAEQPEYARRLTSLRDRLISGILASIPDVRLNGHATQRLPGNANVSVRFIEGESLLMRLDLAGVEASSGSACTSGSLDPSHVLLAIGLPHEIAHGSLRLSLGIGNTDADVDYVLDVLPGIVTTLRAMSPLNPTNACAAV